MTSSSSTASNCAETSYTTPGGMQFSLYCNKDQTGLYDIDNMGADTVEACLDRCSQHSAHVCGAAAFDTTKLECFFKNRNATMAGTNRRDGWILGVANETQLQPLPLACTNNGQNQAAQNGLSFTVYCGQDMRGFDACPDSFPHCRSHTSTLQECLDSCSTLHPRCTGVVWDPSLDDGYLNCYPKNSTAQDFDDHRAPSSISHQSAKALLEAAPDECLSIVNTTVTASNGADFKLSCDEDRPGNDVTAPRHTPSLLTCVNSCATHTGNKCTGIVFDANMVNGYENCYLKAAIGGSAVKLGGFTFAVRQIAANISTTPVSSTSPAQRRHEGRTLWIVGPIFGAVAVVVVLLAMIWWARSWARRRKQMLSAHNTGPQQEAWMKVELDPATVVVPRHELGSSRRCFEMESTTSVLPGREF